MVPIDPDPALDGWGVYRVDATDSEVIIAAYENDPPRGWDAKKAVVEKPLVYELDDGDYEYIGVVRLR